MNRNTLRSPHLSALYKKHRAEHSTVDTCILCTKEPIQNFRYWKIVKNDFPYDLIAETHHMLVPHTHVTERNITPEELSELYKIKQEQLNKYNYILEPSIHAKSIPEHFHLHLIVAKDLNKVHRSSQ